MQGKNTFKNTFFHHLSKTLVSQGLNVVSTHNFVDLSDQMKIAVQLLNFQFQVNKSFRTKKTEIPFNKS